MIKRPSALHCFKFFHRRARPGVNLPPRGGSRAAYIKCAPPLAQIAFYPKPTTESIMPPQTIPTNRQKVTADAKPVVQKQKKQSAGLFVTAEYDKATAHCRSKVKGMADDCRRRNFRFRDISWDLEKDRGYCLHQPDTCLEDEPKFKPAAVKRVSQIFDKPVFFEGGHANADVIQGSVDDCGFLSAIAAVSTRDGLIEKLCVARDEQVGIYGFIFCIDGIWRDVIVDDQLFVKAPRWESLDAKAQKLYHGDRDAYEKVGRKGSSILYFAKSRNENETWVPLMEKAFAKLHGDYQALEGESTNEAIEDLTGGISDSIYINDIMDTDLFWTKYLVRANQDMLFSCFIDQPKSSPTNSMYVKGLVMDHGYAVLKALEFRGKRFVKLRNPWGKSEWKGRWSDGSEEWNGEWLEALKALDHSFGDDGVFIMEYCDFLEHWEAVERTQLFDETWVHSSHWLNARTRPLGSAIQFGDVSFTFTVPKRTDAIIALSQSDTRLYSAVASAAMWSFDFKLFKKGSPRVLGSSTYSYGITRSSTLNINLTPGEYVVHVSTFRWRFLDKTNAREQVRLNRRLNGTQMTRLEKVGTWPYKKMAALWSRLAQSQSIAANFNPKTWQQYTTVPLSIFAGRDIVQVHNRYHEQTGRQRAIMQAKRQGIDPPEEPSEEPETEEPQQEEPEDEEQVVQEDDGNGEEWVDETEESAVEAEAEGQDEAEGQPEQERPTGPTQTTYCDGCGGYDLCDRCHSSGFHEHEMLAIEHPGDVMWIEAQELPTLITLKEFKDDLNLVLLGLRVYSKCPINISGQLANGYSFSSGLSSLSDLQKVNPKSPTAPVSEKVPPTSMPMGTAAPDIVKDWSAAKAPPVQAPYTRD
ncbi:hypothetical protein HWV62_22746 [Athelia sp. TMB]|nr:hypothetical protein HWV62_22746 [Athelia sp. TMB]